MNTELDIISSLPDSLIHHIFSFLDVESIIPTTVLSRRWLNLWASNPYLTFNYSPIQLNPDPSNFHDPYQLNEFIDFVDRILVSRDSSTIHKFSLICDDQIPKSRVLTWLIAVLRRKVQEIELVLVLDQPCNFPWNLFSSDVKELSLSGNYGDVNIRLPWSVCFGKKIRVLDLDFVKLPDGDRKGELKFECPNLEKLVLSRCEIDHIKILTILCVKLKRLKLVSAYETPDFLCKINVGIGNLEYLAVACDTHWDFGLQNLCGLSDAVMAVGADFDMEKEVYAKWLLKFFRGIGNVRSLTVTAEIFQAVAGSSDILEMLPSQFHNLRVLTLEVGIDNFTSLNQAIATILKTLPCIETFVLKRYMDIDLELDEAKDDWGTCLAVDCKFNSLTLLKIYNPCMTEDEHKFMQFILERAIYLKEILFITPNKNVNGTSVEHVTIHRATSDVLVHYKMGTEFQ
ncbi:hypothetical protein ACHQM5_006953 [Ranunculus cassubicifolius]